MYIHLYIYIHIHICILFTYTNSPAPCVLASVCVSAVRQDRNPQLKQGVVGAFVITRALAMLQASDGCTALPLSCGPPLGYFNWGMIATGAGECV